MGEPLQAVKRNNCNDKITIFYALREGKTALTPSIAWPSCPPGLMYLTSFAGGRLPRPGFLWSGMSLDFLHEPAEGTRGSVPVQARRSPCLETPWPRVERSWKEIKKQAKPPDMSTFSRQCRCGTIPRFASYAIEQTR